MSVTVALDEARGKTPMRLLVGVIAAIAIGSLPAAAADIRAFPNFGAVLEGKIERGDFQKLHSFLFDSFPQEIYLASLGGDLAEAMKIGRLVRSLKLETVVPGKYPRCLKNATQVADKCRSIADFVRHRLKPPKADYMCASACFFVFVAGIKRFVDSPLGSAILGIHRPYLSDSDLKAETSDEAIAAADRTRAAVDSYLREMGVPAKYEDEMFGISKNDIRWISDDEVRADFDGFIPELRDWADARCDKRSDNEKYVWEQMMRGKTVAELSPTERAMVTTLFEKYSQQVQCENKLQSELADQAYLQALKHQNRQLPAPPK
jgi:hypothetical protein